jgi:hypothetical protein
VKKAEQSWCRKAVLASEATLPRQEKEFSWDSRHLMIIAGKRLLALMREVIAGRI